LAGRARDDVEVGDVDAIVDGGHADQRQAPSGAGHEEPGEHVHGLRAAGVHTWHGQREVLLDVALGIRLEGCVAQEAAGAFRGLHVQEDMRPRRHARIHVEVEHELLRAADGHLVAQLGAQVVRVIADRDGIAGAQAGRQRQEREQ